MTQVIEIVVIISNSTATQDYDQKQKQKNNYDSKKETDKHNTEKMKNYSGEYDDAANSFQKHMKHKVKMDFQNFVK